MNEAGAETMIPLQRSYWPARTDWPLLDWSLGDALRDAAGAVPDRDALVEATPQGDPARRWTYAELLEWSERTARALLREFEPGERVAVCAPNIVEWIPLLYGCSLAGIVLVTINPACKTREVRHILEKSGAVGLFVVRRFRENPCLDTVIRMREDLPHLRAIIPMEEFDAFVARGADGTALPPVAPLDPCLTLFTSGTTGQPKGVVLHHKGVLNMAHMTHHRGGLQDGGVFVSPMPMFYIGGLGHSGIGAVAHRATHVVVPHWEPELYMRLVERERGTYSLLVPTMIEAILAHPKRKEYDLSSLTNLISGASVVEGQLVMRIKGELGATICNVYGQTEMHGVSISTQRDDALERQTATIGQPIPHMDVMIADPESGEAVPLGEEGEIWVRGFQNMLGYFGQPEETARTLRPDGWLRSGDLARMDGEGYVTITGRIKEMIIRGGENVYPREVEAVLSEHPAVSAVAVIGIPDPYWGEQVAAIVIPADGASPDPAELREFARQNLMSYKAPSLWGFVSEFPVTDTGKLRKFKLCEDAVSGRIALTETKSIHKIEHHA
ncbi:AMP-binding protein [Tsuneonella sp. CC-YZS046]|uniref:class I adenylate-forming enzyme family protein n=1 Tax=Tsuneonella sp. CC-YZS046 TaxID=3042152 RepID=UPI002D784E1E|nr:AMP-binding protein [Tsuneonella sp. CC-YZS046]WRO65334.1 AMP-binding protein [Tsuneonella sp. CC-YZS046]